MKINQGFADTPFNEIVPAKFIMYLSKLGQRNGEDHDTVNYADLAAVVLRKDSMDFLQDIVPKKIKYSEYLKMMEDEKSDDADSLF